MIKVAETDPKDKMKKKKRPQKQQKEISEIIELLANSNQPTFNMAPQRNHLNSSLIKSNIFTSFTQRPISQTPVEDAFPVEIEFG